MSTPRVSVILPAYNAEMYLAEAIESILGQTYTDFELIILNDGSTDNTPEIIKHYADLDERIVFIDNNVNQGLIAVLNQGLDMARGEFVARMDSDDISLPTRFEKQVKYLDANPDVGVLGTLIHGFGKFDLSGIQIPVVTALDMLKENYIAHPSVMMRKSILDKYNLRYDPKYNHCEDIELWTRMIFLTKFRNIMEVLLMYRITGNNISMQNWAHQQNLSKQIKNDLRRRLAAAGKIRLDDLGFNSAPLMRAEKISLYD
ncbi:MAG: glycosyltransferase family 2 protein [Alphaproteobacteria bacterium]|nr:glycosyltransferase family 2 protein [Alphaproteobacteria bacterium]